MTREQQPDISRAVLGVGIASTMGWIMGGLRGAGVGAAVGLALSRVAKPVTKKGVVDDERRALYRRAMRLIESPEQLEQIAAAFAVEELPAHAEMLRRKAALRRLPPDTARERRLTFLRGLASSKPESVERLAATYHVEGALVAARALREHAADLRAIAERGGDAATVARLEKRLALVREAFASNSVQVKSAETNLAAAREHSRASVD